MNTPIETSSPETDQYWQWGERSQDKQLLLLAQKLCSSQGGDKVKHGHFSA